MSQAQFWLYSEGDDKYVNQQQQEEKKKKLLTLLKEVIQQLIAEVVDHKEQISIQNPAAAKLCHLIELILSNGLKEKFGELPTFWKLLDNPRYLRELEIPDADMKRLDILKCRIWIRYALNKKRIGTFVGEAISNAAVVNQWYHEWALIRVLDQSTVVVHLLLSLETIDFKLSLHNIEAHPDETELLDLKKKPLTRSSTVKKKRSKLVSIESADPEDSPRSERSVSDVMSDVSGAESARTSEEAMQLTAELETLRTQYRALLDQLRTHELRAESVTERERSVETRTNELETHVNELETRDRVLDEQRAVLTRGEEELSVAMAGVKQKTADLALREEQLTAQRTELEQRERMLSQQSEEVMRREGETAQRGEDLTRRETDLTQRGEDLTRRERDLALRGDDLTQREHDVARKLDEISRREQEMAQKGNEVSREAAELEQRDEELTRRGTDLEHQTRAIAEQMSALDTRGLELTAAQTQLTEQQRAVELLKDELVQQQAVLNEQQRAWNERHGALEFQARDLDERASQLSAREAQLTELERRLEARDAELNLREEHVIEQQSTLARDRSALESRTQEIKAREDELTRVTLEQVRAEDTEGRTSAHIEELTVRLAQLSEQLTAERKEFESQSTRARETADRVLKESRARDQSASEQITALQQSEAALRLRVEGSAREYEVARAELLSQLSHQQSQYSDATQQIAQLTAQVQGHEVQASEHTATRARVAELEQSCATLAEQLQSAVESRQQLTVELTRVQEELTRVKHECDIQGRELETVRHELSEARSAHDSSDSTLQQTVDRQADSIVQLTEQLHHLTEQTAALTTERGTALTRVTELQQSLDRLSQQFDFKASQLTHDLTRATEQHATDQATLARELEREQQEHASVVHDLREELAQLRTQLANQRGDEAVTRELDLVREQNALLQSRVSLLVHSEEELQRVQQALDQHADQAREREVVIRALQDEVAQLRAQLSDRDQQVLDETDAEEKDRAISADSSLSQTPLDQSPLSLSTSLSQGQNTPPTDSLLDSPLPGRTLLQPVLSANKVDKVASNRLVLYDDYNPESTPRTLLQSFARESDSESEDSDIILAPSDITVKQLIKRKESEKDPREVTERLKTMNTVKPQWQPPKKQMHYYPHEKLAKSVVLAQQGYLCAGCGKQLLMRTGDVTKSVRYCEYSGKYFCTVCHKNDKFVVPARIIFEWDFKRYPISIFYKQFLKEMSQEPLIDIQALNPQLYNQVAEFKYIRVARRQLFYLKDFVFTCRDKDKLLDSHINTRLHLVDSRYYSLQDLVDIQSGKLHQDLKAVLLKWVGHVARCELCKVKGSYCEFCKSTEILYPFQLRSVVVCRHCKALAHRTCYREDQCPKCLRIQKRLSTSGTNNTNESEPDAFDSL